MHTHRSEWRMPCAIKKMKGRLTKEQVCVSVLCVCISACMHHLCVCVCMSMPACTNICPSACMHHVCMFALCVNTYMCTCNKYIYVTNI